METVTQVKLSDWVAAQLATHGIRDVFMLTGGGAMHLNHSLGTHPALATTFTHQDRKSTRLNSSHIQKSRMPSSA